MTRMLEAASTPSSVMARYRWESRVAADQLDAILARDRLQTRLATVRAGNDRLRPGDSDMSA